MGRFYRFILPIPVFAAVGLAGPPILASNIGADFPERCVACRCQCCSCSGAPSGPVGNCSSSEPCNAGACFSRTEGNARQTYPEVAVRSSTGAMLDLSLTYDSYNADTSRARFNTILGIGWTHSYNLFLFSQVGNIFRVDGDGRVTKYQLGPGGTYTAAPGYFETIVKNSDGSFTITDKYGTLTHYVQIAGTPFMQGTAVWRLTSITDRNNNVTTLGYVGGNLMTVTDTYTRTIAFTYYTSNNRLMSVTDPLGRVTSFAYDSTGTQLMKITDPAGNTTQFTYNLFSQITSKTDKDGRIFTYSHINNEPTGFTDSTGAPYFSMSNSTNWATNPTQLAMNEIRQYTPSTTSKTDGNGNVWKYTYDLHGYVTSMMAPDGATWNYTYDPTTLMPATQTDADGNTTTYSYDSEGNLIKKTDALGFVTTYAYQPPPPSGFSQLTMVTDPNGRTTTYSYDAHGNRTDLTDPLGFTEFWTYDAHGNVTSHTDKNGNTTTYAYDAFGNRIQQTDPSPLLYVTTMTYDGVGNLTSRTDPDGNTTTYTYDALDRVIVVTDPLGYTIVTVYDGEGDKVQVTDRDTHPTQYQYDQRRRLIKETDALGVATGTDHSTQYQYDNNNNVTSVTDKNGNTTTYAYDVQNRRITIADALGETTKLTYDFVGNVTSITDANGHTTTYNPDPLNRVMAQTDAIASITKFGYDFTFPCSGCTGPTKGSRLVSMKTDGDGNVIYYGYDGLDRLIIEVHKQGGTAPIVTASDAVTLYTYDPVGNQLTWTEPDTNTTSYFYDQDNRKTKEVNQAGDTTQWTYDGVGNILSITAPTTNVTNFSYDADYRVILVDDLVGKISSFTYDGEGNQLTRTDGNGNINGTTYDAIYRVVQVTDPLGNSFSYNYDPVGNLLSMTDRDGDTTSFTYDAVNRRITLTDAIGNAIGMDHTTQYGYDKVGYVRTLTDANGHVTTFIYDAVNRLINECYADGFCRSYNYDFVGNLTSRTDQNGNITNYTYSDLYFLLQRSYPTPPDEPPNPSDIMTYDLSGRLLTAMKGTWPVTFAYDGANRVTQTVQNGKTITYTYKIPARIETITYPGGRTITEHTDLRSRLSQIDDPTSATPIVQYNYDLADRVQQRNYRNGTTAAYNYNDCVGGQCEDWVTTLQHSAGATPIAGFAYAYDNEGNKQYEQKLQDLGHSELYLPYDADHRLTNFQVGTLDLSTTPPTIPAPITKTQYTYDPVGNITSKMNAVPETRTYNAVNELTTDTIDGSPPCSLSYDNNGNLINECIYAYNYDEENRLTMVTQLSDSTIVGQYQYDALGRRVQKMSPSVTPTTTLYFYDDARSVEEQDPSGTTQATYVYGNYVDEVLTMDRGGQPYYYHQNALWSVAAITDGTASVVERDAYEAYGMPTTMASAIGNPYLFTGRQFDPESSDYFYRSRYYDPVKDRFLQRDRLDYLAGTNLYEYVEDRPTFNVDPDGDQMRRGPGFYVYGQATGSAITPGFYVSGIATPGFYRYPNAPAGPFFGPVAALGPGGLPYWKPGGGPGSPPLFRAFWPLVGFWPPSVPFGGVFLPPPLLPVLIGAGADAPMTRGSVGVGAVPPGSAQPGFAQLSFPINLTTQSPNFPYGEPLRPSTTTQVPTLCGESCPPNTETAFPTIDVGQPVPPNPFPSTEFPITAVSNEISCPLAPETQIPRSPTPKSLLPNYIDFLSRVY